MIGPTHLRRRFFRRPPRPAAPAPLRRPGADWAWRPGPWAGQGPAAGPLPEQSGADLSDGVRLFHDAAAPALYLARPAAEEGSAPLHLEIAGFAGGFLSFAIALPEAMLSGLARRHIVGLETRLDPDAPRAFARLNLQQGPNTETLLRDLPPGRARTAEFDLWTAETEPGRVSSGWIDLIFEAPLPARIAVHDLVVARLPRAAF